MLLIGTPNSPFARKVRILMLEKGIAFDEITEMPSAEGNRVATFNPLGKVPVLRTDDERNLFDSAVIVQYLETLPPRFHLLPEPDAERIEVLRWEALADGCMDAMALTIAEGRRADPQQRSAQWIAHQRAKIDRAVAAMAQELGERTYCHGERFSLADVAVGSCLGFLDLRFPDVAWRTNARLVALFERLCARPSFAATVPPGP